MMNKIKAILGYAKENQMEAAVYIIAFIYIVSFAVEIYKASNYSN
jgi:hypothetical protein